MQWDDSNFALACLQKAYESSIPIVINIDEIIKDLQVLCHISGA